MEFQVNRVAAGEKLTCIQLTAAVLGFSGLQDIGWHGEKAKVNFALPGVPFVLQITIQ